MPATKIKSFWIAACLSLILFIILISIRLDLPAKLFTKRLPVNTLNSAETTADKDAWMNIFQNNKKIGYTHSMFSRQENGFSINETVFMRINTMGRVQDLLVRTHGTLQPDFSLSSFNFDITSGAFNFSAQGTVSDNNLSVKTKSAGTERNVDIRLKKKPYLVTGILNTIDVSEMKPGTKYTYDIFDPATMGQEPAFITIIGNEDIQILGSTQTATKISMNFKGAKQVAWVDKNGDVLKEEGLMGITLVKTTPEDARAHIDQASDDLVEAVSIASNIKLKKPDSLSNLEVEIEGIDTRSVDLDGGRQRLKGNTLFIQKESLDGLPISFSEKDLTEEERSFLKPTPFVQSDHVKIKAMTRTIVSDNDTPSQKAQKLLEWIHKHIDKKPVISLPDALSTLKNREGDCNEHAALMAAFARAQGIPAKVEAGVVYLNGRFYYHAWNLLYLGEWVTADSLFGQLPADVTHIRFSSGELKEQLNLMSIIGHVKLKITSTSK